MNEHPDDVLRRVLRRQGEVDPSVLAAYLDGSLPAAERLKFERLLAANPEAQLLLREARQRRPGKPTVLLAVAALVMVAVGVAWWTWGRSPTTPRQGLAARMAQASAQLQGAHGSLRDFQPLADDELRTAPAVRRGTGAWRGPRGTLLHAPEQLRWTLPAGATRVAVTVDGPTGPWRQVVGGDHIRAPTFAPGHYAVSMRPLDSLAGQVVRSSFVVLNERERTRFKEAMQVIRTKLDDDIEDLVVAHFSIRRGAYAAARSALARAAQGKAEIQERARALSTHLDALGID